MNVRRLRLVWTGEPGVQYMISEAGDSDPYYEIPAELASPFLAAQAEADRFYALIMWHVQDRHLQEQPPIEETR